MVSARVAAGPEKATVTATFPPPADAWPTELRGDWGIARDRPLEPASPEAAATLYRFQVKLAWQRAVWRRMELRGDQTLHDLHNAIQAAFGWGDDHLYAFFLSGKAWDQASRYDSPYNEDAGHSAGEYRLQELSFATGRQILYVFDFGDELRHSIKVEAVVPGGVEPGVAYPRVTERHGENIPQYPDVDEGW